MYIESLKLSGNKAFAAGNTAVALGHFNTAIEMMEKETKAATAEKGNEGSSSAAPSFTHPQAAALYSNRAMVYLKMERYREALADADRCIAAKPNWWKGYARRAFAMEGLDCFKECEACLEKAIALDDSDKKSSTADLLVKLRHVKAVVAKQAKEKTAPTAVPQGANGAASSSSSSKKGHSAAVDHPGIFGDWHSAVQMGEVEDIAVPTSGSRKGKVLTTRPSILDYAPPRPGMPMFFTARPTWMDHPDSFSDDFILSITDKNGVAPPANELKKLIKLAATSLTNQKKADDAFRAANGSSSALCCGFCGVTLAMDSPPSCECGELYCSRQCMELEWEAHKKLCETIRSQSQTAAIFHQVYWQGCGYGCLPWAGERVKNYSAVYQQARRELGEEGGKKKKNKDKKTNENNKKKDEETSEDPSSSPSPTECIDLASLDEVASAKEDEMDEFNYLMLFERGYCIKALADLQSRREEAKKAREAAEEAKEREEKKAEEEGGERAAESTAAAKAKLADAVEALAEATSDLFAGVLELYMKYSYLDKQRDSGHRVQYKITMLEFLMGIITQLGLTRHVEPLGISIGRLEQFLKSLPVEALVTPDSVADAFLKRIQI